MFRKHSLSLFRHIFNIATINSRKTPDPKKIEKKKYESEYMKINIFGLRKKDLTH